MKKWLFGLVEKDLLLCLSHFSLDSLLPHVCGGVAKDPGGDPPPVKADNEECPP
jgi:hypothetical protein